MLGEMKLNITKPYKYLGHIINDNLYIEGDIKAKEWCLCGRCNVYVENFTSVLNM